MTVQRDAVTPFDAAVAIQSVGPGRYRAGVDPAWDGPATPNGGVLTAIMVRAAQAELGPAGPPVRTVSAQFLDAPDHGPVEVEVQILRAGKRVAVCDARMRQADRLITQMTLICSAARSQDSGPVDRPPPAPDFHLVPALDPVRLSQPPFLHRVQLRPAFGPELFSGASDAVSGGWMSLRDDAAPLDAARLCALSDLWWPPIFGRLTAPAAVPTLQLTVYLRRTATAVHGPALARFQTRTVQEGHIEERGGLWSSTGELLAESQQLALLLPIP